MQKRNYVTPDVHTLKVSIEDVLLASGGGLADDVYNDGWEEIL